uniref:Uncharacterized protein n=1 Tax=Peronospora matthiolae TaxID=2874970 RepID=A0AAV1TL16_9STRA
MILEDVSVGIKVLETSHVSCRQVHWFSYIAHNCIPLKVAILLYLFKHVLSIRSYALSCDAPGSPGFSSTLVG